MLGRSSLGRRQHNWQKVRARPPDFSGNPRRWARFTWSHTGLRARRGPGLGVTRFCPPPNSSPFLPRGLAVSFRAGPYTSRSQPGCELANVLQVKELLTSASHWARGGGRKLGRTQRMFSSAPMKHTGSPLYRNTVQPYFKNTR